MQQKFEATLAKVPMRQIYSARLERDEAADYVREAQVWFWRFRPEYSAEVERRQPELDRAQARLDELEAERDAIMVEARQVVGIWSEVRGVPVLVLGRIRGVAPSTKYHVARWWFRVRVCGTDVRYALPMSPTNRD